jgi:S1-C subfamily serine protease
VAVIFPRVPRVPRVRAFAVATLLLLLAPAAAQAPAVLHIRVVLADAAGKPVPVPRHALLISDNPSTAPPRRVVTGLDGTADVRLRPGNYTVESDEPAAFQGKAYQWTRTIDVAAGRDTNLDLTRANAEIGPLASISGAPPKADLSSLLNQFQDSVVAIWTPDTHASGFLIDANGLIATNQRVVGTATSVEVQLTPEVKVAASILAADAGRDAAVLWIDPKVAASMRPVPLGCAATTKPGVSEGDELTTIGAPLRLQKGPAFGKVSRVDAHAIASDLILPAGSAGGPVFTDANALVGITSVADEKVDERRGNSRIVLVDDVCEVVASAEKKMKGAAPPDGTPLPVEPAWPFPEEALKAAAQRRAGSLSPYQMASADFDIAFMTPLQVYGAQYQAEQMNARGRSTSGTRSSNARQAPLPPVMEFGNWSEYVWDFPPVLLVRVTPRLVEGLLTKVARGAASTQGAVIPPIKHAKSSFLRLRAFCGDAEVRPIHPFKLEQRVREATAISEGLYVFDATSLAPSCPAVRLAVYSEKEPEKADTRTVDPKVVQQIWSDFEPYRQ